MMGTVPNAQYNVASAGSIPVRVAASVRRRMFRLFLQMSGIEPHESLLDVGVTSDRSYEASNYVEAWYPYKDRITAVGIDDAAFLEEMYPGMVFRRENGLDLSFPDRSFDIVHSSAVLEHVGGAADQRRLIAELVRVARRGVFLTTPNRWFPVEFHTVLPLVHWLPKKAFRAFLQHSGRAFFAKEENLNLLGRRDLASLAPREYRSEVTSVSLLGWPSNLILWIDKTPP